MNYKERLNKLYGEAFDPDIFLIKNIASGSDSHAERVMENIKDSKLKELLDICNKNIYGPHRQIALTAYQRILRELSQRKIYNK